jgi:hypothetical protein
MLLYKYSILSVSSLITIVVNDEYLIYSVKYGIRRCDFSSHE